MVLDVADEDPEICGGEGPVDPYVVAKSVVAQVDQVVRLVLVVLPLHPSKAVTAQEVLRLLLGDIPVGAASEDDGDRAVWHARRVQLGQHGREDEPGGGLPGVVIYHNRHRLGALYHLGQGRGPYGVAQRPEDLRIGVLCPRQVGGDVELAYVVLVRDRRGLGAVSVLESDLHAKTPPK